MEDQTLSEAIRKTKQIHEFERRFSQLKEVEVKFPELTRRMENKAQIREARRTFEASSPAATCPQRT